MRHYAPEYFLKDIHKISIALVGVGGTGSQVLTSLGRIDHCLKQLGNKGLDVTIFDPDTVSISNQGRQLFSNNDIGLSKSIVLTSRINRFFGTDWTAYKKKYFINNCECHNIVITCTDTVKSRREVFSKTIINSMNVTRDEYRSFYWLDFGNNNNSGQVVLGSFNDIEQPLISKYDTRKKLKTLFDIYPNIKDEEGDNTPSCSLAEALTSQDLFINSALVPFGMDILWKLLTQYYLESHGCYINLKELKVSPINI